MKRRRFLLRLGLGCSAAAGAALPPAVGAAEPVVVDIRDYRFMPAALTVKVGTTVKWTNSEKRTTHSVLFTGNGGFESERLFPGEAWQRTFDQPGRYAYTCGPHPEMKGWIEAAP